MVERSGTTVSRQGLRGPLANLLDRFRRSAGVPAAAGADLASELAPVFAALDEIEGEADALGRAAETERAARSARAEREARRILDDAQAEADRVRDEAFEVARRAGEAEAAAIAADGERRAAAIRKTGEERLPRLVEEVVAGLVEEEAGAGPDEGRA